MTIKFTKQHEWVLREDTVGTVGITTYAQKQLGDVVYVELPEIGKTFKQGDEVAVVESVKAASEVYAPVSGEVIAVNSALETQPALVNTDAEGEGWFFKVRFSNQDELEALLDTQPYKTLIEG